MAYIACVLKGGSLYDETWVRRLADALWHNGCFLPVYCLTDIDKPMSGVHTIPLVRNWPGWWSKIELFRPDMPSGACIYLDLDMAVLRPIEALVRAADHGSRFAGADDFLRPGKINSSVMLFRAGMHASLFRAFDAASADAMHLYRRGGDQDFISELVGRDWIAVQDECPGLLKSYKADKLENGPGDAALVQFHGRPKMPDFSEGWVHEYWNG